MNPETKQTREERHTAKRLAEINELLSEHVSRAPRPARPSILHIVAAFGLDASLPDCHGERSHADPWANLDAKENAVRDSLSFQGYSPKERATMTREEVLWQHVRPILRRRLFYRVNNDLLPAWKQAEMQRVAKLTGFDYAAEWEKICRETLPPPKSWGADIDPQTLEPTTLAGKWLAQKKKLGLIAPKTPKPPVGRKLGEREKRKSGGVVQFLYPVRVIYEDGHLGQVQECWFANDEEAAAQLRVMAQRGRRKVQSIVVGPPDDVTIVTIAPQKKAA